MQLDIKQRFFLTDKKMTCLFSLTFFNLLQQNGKIIENFATFDLIIFENKQQQNSL